MKYSALFLIMFSGLLFAAESKTTVCSYEGSQRTIEVAYPEGNDVPCEVRYTKSSGTQVLWSAQSEIGFCEAKAEAFIEKQRGWGWNCEVVGAPEPEASESSSK